MKSIILVAFALVAIAAAARADNRAAIIIASNKEQLYDGSYVFSYETEDGSSRKETGTVKEVRNEDNDLQKVVVVNGVYSYVNDAGNKDTVTYFADETGYHAEGDSIPKVVSRR